MPEGRSDAAEVIPIRPRRGDGEDTGTEEVRRRFDRWEYRGRWALVTGASSGIGEAFAEALAGRGMHLVLAARRVEKLREVAARAKRVHGVEAVVVPVDLARPGAPGVLWVEASNGREIDLLVNNAGFGLRGRFDRLPLERQAEMVRVNCTAPLELAHFALRAMRERGRGGIVNVASTSAYQPVPYMAAYAATKAFLLSLSEALAEENDGRVRVVALSPGPVATEFQQVAGTGLPAHTPGVRSAEEVVEEALAALESGRRAVVPGVLNRVASVAARVLPRGVVLKAARTLMTRMR